MDGHSNSEHPSHSGHHYTSSPAQTYSEQQLREQTAEVIPPIHRVMMHEPGLLDVAALRHSQYLAQVSPYIKSELSYEDIQAQQLRPDYIGATPGVPAHFFPRTTEDISTELLKLHQANLVNAELAAAATVLPQPLNLQQSMTPQYKHPMLHLYDAAMQQQQQDEKYKYDNVTSSDDSNDSDDDDGPTTNPKEESAALVPVELVTKAVPVTEAGRLENLDGDTATVGDSRDVSRGIASEEVVQLQYKNESNVTMDEDGALGSSVGAQKRPYDCGSCGTCFIVQCGAEGHKVIDSLELTYVCELCQEKFASVDLLQSHVRRHYDKSIPVDLRTSSTKKPQKSSEKADKAPYTKPECLICGQRFNTKVNLKKHEKVHNREKPYGCGLCKRKFVKIELLSDHGCACQSKVKRFVCDVCNRGFMAEAGLLSHRRASHQLGITYKCHICKSRFEDIRGLDDHLETHNEVPSGPSTTHKSTVTSTSTDTSHTQSTGGTSMVSASANTTGSGKEDMEDESEEDDSDSDTDEYDNDSFESALVDDLAADENLEKHIEKLAAQQITDDICCMMCEEKFDDKDKLKAHIRKHFAEVCKSSDKLSELNHKLKDDPSTEKFNCHICEKSFPSSLELGIHISTHRINQDQFKCTVCGDGFSYKACLKKHMKRQHGNKSTPDEDDRSKKPQPVCDICGIKFKDAINLRRHAIVHDTNKQFECTYCGKCFSRHDGLRAHVRTHTGEKPYKCGICGVTCATSSGLNIHKKSHNDAKPFSCHICGKLYKYRLSLNLHLSTHTGKKPYSCEECGRSFYDPSSFKKHKVIHTGIKAHVCHICGNSFFRRESLTKHIKTHNPNFTKKLYPCTQCKKVYNTASGLIIHKRTHSGEKPFKCEFCSRYFATKSTLLSHSRTHSGEKPYVCDHCGKRFIQATPLKMHMKRVHNNMWTSADNLTSSSIGKSSIHETLPTQVPTSYAYELMYGFSNTQSMNLHGDAHAETQWKIPATALSEVQSHSSPVLNERNAQTPLIVEPNCLLPEQARLLVEQSRLLSEQNRLLPPEAGHVLIDARRHGAAYPNAALDSHNVTASSLSESGVSNSLLGDQRNTHTPLQMETQRHPSELITECQGHLPSL